MTRVVTTVALAALYLAVLGSLALADVVVGLGAGGLLSFAFTPAAPLSLRAALTRVLWLPIFLVGVAREVLRGAAGMVLVVLGVRDWQRQGLVEIELGERSPLGVTVSALVTGLSPGSVVVDIDHEGGRMIVHVIDASEPARTQRDQRRFYERFQRAVFP